MGERELGGLVSDTDREQWVQNDEQLYIWWQSTKQSLRAFVRDNRALLTAYITRRLNK
jgi:hypothetical protein